MRKQHLYFPLLTLAGVLVMFLSAGSLLPQNVWALNCTVPISGDMTTINSTANSCTFPNNTDGIDSGTSSNTAVLTLSGGATLTIGGLQTIAVGSLVPGNGSIAIVQGGQIKIGTPVWMVDADADGWPDTTTQYIQTTAPTNGRRRNLMRSITQADTSVGVACGANGSSAGTCQVCNNGGIQNSTVGTDPNNECAASWNACSSSCVKTGPDGNCNGSGACNTGGGSANVADQTVCSGGSEVIASTSVYASVSNSCTAASCGGTKYYRACNGAGATRSDNTGAASQAVNATAGQSLDTSCNSGANGNPGATCQKCNGSGAVTVQANTEDLYNQCTLTYNGCNGASGTNGICVKTASVGDLCNGTTAACAAGSNANVADQTVCSGGSEVIASTSVYASTADVCTAGSCQGTRYYRACNGVGATRSDNTGAASGPINATNGNTFTAACASSTASTCTTRNACKTNTYCNGSGACNTPANVGVGTDTYNDCAASWNACSSSCVKTGPDGNCNGSGACNTGGASANVAIGYVCSGGTEYAVSSSYYCSTANVCSAGACSGFTYYDSCDAAGACRTNHTGAAYTTIYATNGNTFTAACASSTASTCTVRTACVNNAYCNGSGSCVPVSVTAGTDTYNDCAAAPPYNACSFQYPIGPDGNCNGSGACNTTGNTGSACSTAGTCQTGGGCSGGTCTAVVNTGYGIQGTGCTATHYVCNGAGACILPMSVTGCLPSVPSVDCNNACVTAGYVSCNWQWSNNSCALGGGNCPGTITGHSCKCNYYTY